MGGQWWGQEWHTRGWILCTRHTGEDIMTIWILLAVSSFTSVFLMGLQTKNVMYSRYGLAFLTSLGIGGTQLVFVRFAANDSVPLVLLFGVVPAALGICCSIYVHDRWFGRKG
jgi:hypothetical protein